MTMWRSQFLRNPYVVLGRRDLMFCPILLPDFSSSSLFFLMRIAFLPLASLNFLHLGRVRCQEGQVLCLAGSAWKHNHLILHAKTFFLIFAAAVVFRLQRCVKESWPYPLGLQFCAVDMVQILGHFGSLVGLESEQRLQGWDGGGLISCCHPYLISLAGVLLRMKGF